MIHANKPNDLSDIIGVKNIEKKAREVVVEVNKIALKDRFIANDILLWKSSGFITLESTIAL